MGRRTLTLGMQRRREGQIAAHTSLSLTHPLLSFFSSSPFIIALTSLFVFPHFPFHQTNTAYTPPWRTENYPRKRALAFLTSCSRSLSTPSVATAVLPVSCGVPSCCSSCTQQPALCSKHTSSPLQLVRRQPIPKDVLLISTSLTPTLSHDNKIGPNWASHSLGCFVCVRCCSFHRKMGVHISKMKSVSIDMWTQEEIDVSVDPKNNKKKTNSPGCVLRETKSDSQSVFG